MESAARPLLDLPDPLLLDILMRVVERIPRYVSEESFDDKDPRVIRVVVRYPYIHSQAVADSQALARLRITCRAFDRLATQVQGIVLALNSFEETDLRVLNFLHEAEDARTLILDCKSGGGAYILADAITNSQHLRQFCLISSGLSSLDCLEELFEALSGCPHLESLVIEDCRPTLRTFESIVLRNLKELHMSVIDPIRDDSILHSFLQQVVPGVQKLHLQMWQGWPSETLTRISSSTLTHLHLNAHFEPGVTLDIESPGLRESEIAYLGDSMVTRISAPSLESLTVYRSGCGQIVRSEPWKVKWLTVEGWLNEARMLNILQLCDQLKVVDIRGCVSNQPFETSDLTRTAEIIACLRSAEALEINAQMLEAHLVTAGVSTLPTFENLRYLTLDATYTGQVEACLKLVEKCPKLTHLDYWVDDSDSEGVAAFRKVEEDMPSSICFKEHLIGVFMTEGWGLDCPFMVQKGNAR